MSDITATLSSPSITAELAEDPVLLTINSPSISVTIGGLAGVDWGQIGGTLSNQTDLWAALQARAILVSAPANQNDMSVLPGGVAPSSGIYLAPQANVLWVIWGGQSVWWHSDLSQF